MPDELGRTTEENSFADLSGRYRSALEALQSWGVRISDVSRLRIYEQRLEGVGIDASVPVESATAIQLMFDLREIDEITEIVESFPDAPLPHELKKLRMIAAGAEHPDEETRSVARDTQYELYLRAVLTRSGVIPRLGEPDLLVEWKGTAIPIEAKRPKNEDRFDDSLRRAVTQLDRNENSGIVAISLDQLLRPSRHHLSVPTREHMTEVPSLLLRDFVKRNEREIAKRVAGRHVAALLFTLRLPAQDQTTGQACLATGLHIEALAAGLVPGGAVEMLESAIIKGL